MSKRKFYINYKQQKKVLKEVILCRPLKNLLSAIEVNYLYGLIFLQFYTGFVHDMVFGSGQLPFLPLMITSLYCSIGILYGWGCFMLNYLRA